MKGGMLLAGQQMPSSEVSRHKKRICNTERGRQIKRGEMRAGKAGEGGESKANFVQGGTKGMGGWGRGRRGQEKI